MYENYYNLRERPFSLSPDPEYLYPSRVHREALDTLRYGVESRAGFIVITGEIGAGKTTLLQTWLRQLDERTIVGRLVNTTLEPHELLEAIALEFGLDATGKSKPVILRDLAQFLVEARGQSRRPLLIVDEAQNLSAPGLEEVRLLSNLETEKSKLLQMVFVGQPGLRDLIASPELTQFRQRIAVNYHLYPLDPHETVAYIDFRLNHAAIGLPPRFSPEASALVHEVSGGVPRLINVICDGTLIFGYAEERPRIDEWLVREAIVELNESRLLPTDGLPIHLRSSPALPQQTPAKASAAAVEQPAALVGGGNDLALTREAADVAARAARLAEREREVLQRERELAEQKRALEAEIRAFRRLQSQATITARSGNLPDARQGSIAGTGVFRTWFDALRRRVRRILSELRAQRVEHN